MKSSLDGDHSGFSPVIQSTTMSTGSFSLIHYLANARTSNDDALSNADESEETETLILSNIEERVAARYRINTGDAPR
jgi:hypothetical protein